MQQMAVASIALFVLLLLSCQADTSSPNVPQDTPTATLPSLGTPTLEVKPSPTPTVMQAKTLKGVSLSPKSFVGSDFTDFFQKAKDACSLVSWAGDWNELGNTACGGPVVVAQLSSTYSYTPVIEAQFFTQSSGKLLRPLDAATEQGYRDSARAFAEKYKPAYMGFGIEVNILYEKSPSDFDAFVKLFAEVYQDVKSVSPNTKVFTVFQLEKMKGLNGGLFGGTNDASKNQWALLDKFPDSDIVAFTTYPGLVFKKPEDIPPDYYSEIRGHTTKPIAFTEIGWHSAASPAGWESSDEEQARFVETFFRLTNGLESEMDIWSFLYDQNTFEPFNSMGLWRSDGSARPTWDEWTRLW